MVVEGLAASQEVERLPHRQELVEHSASRLEEVGQKGGEEIVRFVSIEMVGYIVRVAIVPATAVEVGSYIEGSESGHPGCWTSPAGVERDPLAM